MMTFAMTSSLLHVVDWTRESMCLLGFAMYRHHLPFRTKTVSGRNWRVFTLNSHIKVVNDFCLSRGRAPPDLSQDDLEILQSKYAQLSLALEESLYASSSHRRGPSPAFASHRVVSPSGAHPFCPHAIRITRVSLSKRMGSAPWGEFASRGSPSPKRIGFASHPYTAMEFASRESLARQRIDLASRRTPSLKRMGFTTRGSPSPSEWDSHQEGHPLQSEWDSLLTPDLVAAETPFKGFFSKATILKGFPFSKGLRLCA